MSSSSRAICSSVKPCHALSMSYKSSDCIMPYIRLSGSPSSRWVGVLTNSVTSWSKVASTKARASAS
ncbi:hypothetical protein [Moraxella lacunata]|uniref:hypothetical protein n=1 Tax=Moraxella lacunata TaxID=477 RepID=UPI003EE0C412